VTDAGLKELAALDQLQTLYLVFTGVTDAGVKELQEAIPKCKIINARITANACVGPRPACGRNCFCRTP
jgi:hypothetical protein